MDNEKDQSKVAYGGLKEVRENKGMPKSEQFGNGNKMPQNSKMKNENSYTKMINRHQEYR